MLITMKYNTEFQNLTILNQKKYIKLNQRKTNKLQSNKPSGQHHICLIKKKSTFTLNISDVPECMIRAYFS